MSEARLIRPEHSRRFRLRPLLLLLIVLAAVGVAISPVLRLQKVEVTGLKRLTEAQVLEEAGIQLGTPRWAYTAGQVENRLKAEPWIKTAHVSWSWDAMQIQVEEREPVGLLPYRDRWVSLDETGLILELVDSPAAAHLPVIGGISTSKALRGQKLNTPGLTDALLVLSWMGDSLRSQVGQVQVDPDRSLTFYLSGRTTVRWGILPETSHDRLSAVQEKLKILGGSLQEIPKQRGSSCEIDLRPEPYVSLSCK